MALIRALQGILSSLHLTNDVSTFLALFSLGFARIVTAISLAPFLGARAVSGRVKVGLAVILMAVLYPAIATGDPPADSLQFVALLIKEVIVGAVLGYVAQLIFFAVQM